MNAFFHIDQARALDRQDPLAEFRHAFHMPVWDKQEVIYLTGNSLGLQPKATSAAIQQELSDWKNLGVEGHFKAQLPWMPYHEFLAASLARLSGAKETEVVAMGSLTANLHFALASFYRPSPERPAILCEAKAFPSDRYALVSQLEFHGYGEADLIEVQGQSEDGVPTEEELLQAIEVHGSRVATLLIGGVNYFTGRFYDMGRITGAAQSKGITVGWDLAHAMGNVPLHLHDWGVDFAAWCSYKYLNAGPGGTAGLFVHERHHQEALPRLAGWWGHNKSSRFQMGPHFDPIPTAEAWQVSNAPVLSMAAQRASLDIFDQVDLSAHRSKGLDLSMRCMNMLDALATELGEAMRMITPREDASRGCQVSVQFLERDRRFFDSLVKRGVLADWREPGTIRMAFIPLYSSYEDLARLEQILREILTA
ncbi:MAG: kynureninase [Schleiferiaceae bacterium]|nr:kynureninase [Schleiferiaceae bacterium]